MSASILVTYATKYGSTQEVAEVVAATLRECGLGVDVQPMRQVRSLDGYQAVVLGAPLYMFHWHKDAIHLLSRHRAALTERPVAVFVLGPASADEKDWRGAREQIGKELAKFPWLKPIALEVLGGKFDPTKLTFPWSLMPGLRKVPASDVRDWAAIRAWASSLVERFRPVSPP